MMSLSLICLADTPENLLECAQKKDSLVRLLCYDEVVKSLNNNKVKTIRNDNAGPTLNNIITPVTSSGTTAPIALEMPSAVNSMQKMTVDSQINQFGSENVELKPGQKVDQLTQVVFTVKSLKKTVYKQWNIVFDNDQIWKQVSSDHMRLNVGDKVEVSKGVLGSYKLKKTGSNRSIRVKRSK